MNAVMETVSTVCNQVRRKSKLGSSFQNLVVSLRREFRLANFNLKIKSTRDKVLGPEEFYVNAYYDAEEDQNNEIVSVLYPYKSPTDKNEDGYRYNLLPYEKSYSKHAATGTLPSRIDVLNQSIAVEIYDKYYKFTAKTNESGDYMIMGVPLGSQSIVMDVDLSDIGEFSLTPQDSNYFVI